MGAPNSKSYHYAVKNHAIDLVLPDNQIYPPKPPDKEVEKEFNEILGEIEIPADKMREVRRQPIETKWKLICRY